MMRKLAHCAVRSCGMAGVKTRIATSTGIRMRTTKRQGIQMDDYEESGGDSSTELSPLFVETGVLDSYKVSIRRKKPC